MKTKQKMQITQEKEASVRHLKMLRASMSVHIKCRKHGWKGPPWVTQSKIAEKGGGRLSTVGAQR